MDGGGPQEVPLLTDGYQRRGESVFTKDVAPERRCSQSEHTQAALNGPSGTRERVHMKLEGNVVKGWGRNMRRGDAVGLMKADYMHV